MGVMASKFERVGLYGVIPIVAALVGALATVWASNYMGHSVPSDAPLYILRNDDISPSEKLKLLQAINHDADKFYEFLGRVLFIVSALAGFLGFAYASRIMSRR